MNDTALDQDVYQTLKDVDAETKKINSKIDDIYTRFWSHTLNIEKDIVKNKEHIVDIEYRPSESLAHEESKTIIDDLHPVRIPIVIHLTSTTGTLHLVIASAALPSTPSNPLPTAVHRGRKKRRESQQTTEIYRSPPAKKRRRSRRTAVRIVAKPV